MYKSRIFISPLLVLFNILAVSSRPEIPCGCIELPISGTKRSNTQTFSPSNNRGECGRLCLSKGAAAYAHDSERSWCVCGTQSDILVCEEEVGPLLEAFCILEPQQDNPAAPQDDFVLEQELVVNGQLFPETIIQDLIAENNDRAERELRPVEAKTQLLNNRDPLLEVKAGDHQDGDDEVAGTTDLPTEADGEPLLEKKDSKVLALILGVVVVICLLVALISVSLKQRCKKSQQMKKKESVAALMAEPASQSTR